MICLLDISGFMYRSYYAMPKLLHNSQEVGALFGFCNEMLNMQKLFRNATFVAALDCSRHTFRSELYPKYKAQRPHMPDDLISQCNLINDCCERFGFKVVKLHGFEADDIIASFTAHYSTLQNNLLQSNLLQSNKQIIVVSSDKDLLQLLNFEHVKVFNPVKRKFITDNDVFKKFGVMPNKLLDTLALTGDSADNVPGVHGIGPKTAAKLINEWNTLENLFENIDKLPKTSIYKNLLSDKDNAILSKQLITLKYDLPLDYSLSNQVPNDLIGFFSFFGFHSLIRKI